MNPNPIKESYLFIYLFFIMPSTNRNHNTIERRDCYLHCGYTWLERTCARPTLCSSCVCAAYSCARLQHRGLCSECICAHCSQTPVSNICPCCSEDGRAPAYARVCVVGVRAFIVCHEVVTCCFFLGFFGQLFVVSSLRFVSRAFITPVRYRISR